MVTAITERNHKLVIWRYALGAACLFLLFLSGYLFRLSETNRHATVIEKAMHAQDNNNHEMVVKNLQEKNEKWRELKTIKVPAEGGAVLIHLLAAQELLLLDLSHLSPLPEGFGYYVYLGEAVGEPSLLVAAGEVTNLREMALYDHQEVLTIYRWPLAKGGVSSASRPESPIVSFPLVEAISLAH